MVEHLANLPRTALIVAVSLSYPRRFRKETTLTGKPLRRTLHSQSVTSMIDIQCMVLEHISRALRLAGSYPLDLYFINSDTGNELGNAWLSLFEGLPLSSGTVRILNRNNSGWSYGAYSYAVDQLLDQYDYFIFTEDDVYVGHPDMLGSLINLFDSSSSTGFISFQGLSSSFFESSGSEYFHARGGVGITSSRVLSHVLSIHHEMPYYSGSATSDYKDIIRNGEVKFTNVIHRLGFQLLELPERWPLMVHYDYDLRRGIALKLKPQPLESFFHLLFYHCKRLAYRLMLFLRIRSR